MEEGWVTSDDEEDSCPCGNSIDLHLTQIYTLEAGKEFCVECVLCRSCLEGWELFCERHNCALICYQQKTSEEESLCAGACVLCQLEKLAGLSPERIGRLAADLRQHNAEMARSIPDMFAKHLRTETLSPDQRVVLALLVLGEFYGSSPEETVEIVKSGRTEHVLQ